MNKERITQKIKVLLDRYPELEKCQESIQDVYFLLENCFNTNHKLLVAGNGGSASDAEHIIGELMKSFKMARPLTKELQTKIQQVSCTACDTLLGNLECALPAISLVSQTSLISAITNDIGAETIYAQQVLGYGQENDVFLGISTSGNSKNVIAAAIVAKAKGLKVIALTGASGGVLKEYADIIVTVPEVQTYKIQELHLPIYHWLCATLEDNFFGK